MAETTYDIDQLMEEWRINGFVVFEDLIPEEKIDAIFKLLKPFTEGKISF